MILMYNKFHEMSNDTIQALKYVEQCQNDNGGKCSRKLPCVEYTLFLFLKLF